MNFNEIVDSISFNEFKSVFLSGNLAYYQKRMEEDKGKLEFQQEQDFIQKEMASMNLSLQEIPDETREEAQKSAQDTLFNIAYFARAISKMHPGWNQKGFEINQEDFKHEVEELYNQQSSLPKESRLKRKDLLTEFCRITSTTIADNHLSVLDENGYRPYKDKEKVEAEWGKPIKKTPYLKGQVGQNSAYAAEGLKQSGWKVDKEIVRRKETDYPLMIAEKKDLITSKTTAVVALSRSFLEEQCPQTLNRLRHNLQNWDDIIIDVRGNGGGNSPSIKAIATAIYGEEVPYCLQEHKPDTQEARLRDFKFRPNSEPQPRWEAKQHPFNERKRGVYILIDREVASSAEAIVPMLKNYPGVQFIGENTCGCCQYGAFKPVVLPCGGWMNIGTVYREYEDGPIECVGHKPDINCVGRDAFQVALKKIEERQKKELMSGYVKEDNSVVVQSENRYQQLVLSSIKNPRSESVHSRLKKASNPICPTSKKIIIRKEPPVND